MLYGSAANSIVSQRRKSQTRIWVSVFSTNCVPLQTHPCYHLRNMANSVRGLLGKLCELSVVLHEPSLVKRDKVNEFLLLTS